MKRNQGSEGELADGPALKKAKTSPVPSSPSTAAIPKEREGDNPNTMTADSATVVTVPADKSKSDPTQYLLTLEQMIENDYPVPSYMADVFQKPEGWVETPQTLNAPPAGTSGVKRKAVDCEMCITEDGKELTRVCIIDFHTNDVVYDQLVKPSKPIVDYLTR
ncbi:hypothetical protein EST38_g11991 [Candolleomyces aberdarensis]|uniref:RNA exonuclease 4 n=1 Tax=Candolleomyces aberdarensis TaxID=2316362 RepID=A0A4Q2D650_9AGAR|nr:hypothetical protein EST38_g11991 [Candolleomyces aberdarensis]